MKVSVNDMILYVSLDHQYKCLKVVNVPVEKVDRKVVTLRHIEDL